MSTAVATIQPRSITTEMATRFGMEPQPFEATLRATVVPKDCTREQFAAFLMVARDYNLNPITREIFAFPTRAGGIQPIVSVDGWMNLMNSHPQMDGLEFEDIKNDKGELAAIKCRVFRKDRTRPVEVIEYMSECRRPTDTWKTWPARMLRHKAAIQAARYAFGFSGIVEPDEFERLNENGTVSRAAPPPPPPPPAAKVINHEPAAPPLAAQPARADNPQPTEPPTLAGATDDGSEAYGALLAELKIATTQTLAREWRGLREKEIAALPDEWRFALEGDFDEWFEGLPI
jgi:phage recombination protein Bet